ncbi:hypothetical protein [Jeotgalibaca porci]|uniref:hypothetical protein n=1 Tax=Jeotgalibaca porci TaxID=1868793 RepID=UPI00359FDEB4
MTVDEMKERWVHKDDVEVLRAIYKNEMTVAEFIEDKEEYISELEYHLSNLKDTLYDLNMETNTIYGTMMDTPLLLSNIKKD